MNIADPMVKRTEFCLNLNVAQGLFTIVTQSRVKYSIYFQIVFLLVFIHIFLIDMSGCSISKI